jgi:hypothetical protein
MQAAGVAAAILTGALLAGCACPDLAQAGGTGAMHPAAPGLCVPDPGDVLPRCMGAVALPAPPHIGRNLAAVSAT